MPLDTAELDWIKKVAQVKTDERKGIKARLEQHLVSSGRAAEPSKLADTASADDVRKDAAKREAERAKREDELQNVVTDKMEIGANAVFTVTGSDTVGGAAVGSASPALLPTSVANARADVRAKALLRITAKGADPKRDRAIAQQIAAADPAAHGGYKPYNDKGVANTAPMPATLTQAVDERKIQIEIDNEVNDEIAAEIEKDVPKTMHPLTRNEEIEKIVTRVAAKYGVTNLAHLIGRHGAERTNPDTNKTTRTTDDMVGRLVGGVGADKKAATVASGGLHGDETAKLSGPGGPGTGETVVVPGYATVGSEAASTSSQHASAKAAIFMAEEGAIEAARLEKQVGTKEFKTKGSVKSDVGKEAVGGEQLGSYEEPGKLGKSFTMPDPLEVNKGATIAPGEIGERIRHTSVTEDNPSAEVTNLVDKVHGGVTPMTMFSKSDARPASAKLERRNSPAVKRDERMAHKKELQDKATAAGNLLTDLTAATGPQEKAKTAAAQAEVKRQGDANAAENAITSNLPPGKQDLARAARTKTIEAAQAARERDDLKARLDKTNERVKQLETEQTGGEVAATAAHGKAKVATANAVKDHSDAEKALTKAREDLLLAPNDAAKKKDVAAKDLAFTKATEALRKAKEEETVAEALALGNLARPEELKKAKDRAAQLDKEHKEAVVRATDAEQQRNLAQTAFADGVDLLKKSAVIGTFDTLAASTLDAKEKQAAKAKIDERVVAAKAQKEIADRESAIAQVSAAVPPATVQADVPGSGTGANGANALAPVAQAAADAAALPGAQVGKAAFDAHAAGKKLGDVIAAARAKAINAALPAAQLAAASPPLPKEITAAVVKAIANKIADKLAEKAAALAVTGAAQNLVEGDVTAARNGARDGAKSVGQNTAKAAVEAAVQAADDAVAQVTAQFARHPLASDTAVQAAADAAKVAATPKAIKAAQDADGDEPDKARSSAYKLAFKAAFSEALKAAQGAFDTKIKNEQNLVKTDLANKLNAAATTSPVELKKVADEQKQGLDEQKVIFAEAQKLRTEEADAAREEHRLKSEAAKASDDKSQIAVKQVKDLADRPAAVQKRLDDAKNDHDAVTKDLGTVKEALKNDATVETNRKLTEEKDKHEQLKVEAKKLGEAAGALATEIAQGENNLAEKGKALEAFRKKEKELGSEKIGAENQLAVVEAKTKEAGKLSDEKASLTKSVEEGAAASEKEAKEIESLSKQVDAERLGVEQLLAKKKSGDEAVAEVEEELSTLESQLSEGQAHREQQQKRLDEVLANKAKEENNLREAEAKNDETAATKLRKKIAGFDKPIEKRTADLRTEDDALAALKLQADEKRKAVEALRGAQISAQDAAKATKELEALQATLQERSKASQQKTEELAQQRKELETLTKNVEKAEQELATLPSSEELTGRIQKLGEDIDKTGREAGALEKDVKEQESALEEKREAQKNKQQAAEAAVRDRDDAEKSVQAANEQNEKAKSEREAVVKKQEELTKKVETAASELKAAQDDKVDCDTNNAANLQKAQEEEAAAKVQAKNDRKAALQADRVAKRLEVEKQNAKAISDAEVALAEAEHEERVAKAVVASGGGPPEVKAAAVAAAKAAHAAAVRAAAAANAAYQVGLVEKDAAQAAHERQKARLQKVQAAVNDLTVKKGTGAKLEDHEEKTLARLAALKKSEQKAEAKFKKLETALTPLKQADDDAVKEVEKKKKEWEDAAK